MIAAAAHLLRHYRHWSWSWSWSGSGLPRRASASTTVSLPLQLKRELHHVLLVKLGGVVNRNEATMHGVCDL